MSSKAVGLESSYGGEYHAVEVPSGARATRGVRYVAKPHDNQNMATSARGQAAGGGGGGWNPSVSAMVPPVSGPDTTSAGFDSAEGAFEVSLHTKLETLNHEP